MLDHIASPEPGHAMVIFIGDQAANIDNLNGREINKSRVLLYDSPQQQHM